MNRRTFFEVAALILLLAAFCFWTLPAQAAVPVIDPAPHMQKQNPPKPNRQDPPWFNPDTEEVIRDKNAPPENYYVPLPEDPKLRVKDPRSWA